MTTTDTIAAVATGSGGAIAIIRMSGPEALSICDKIFSGVSGRKITEADGYTIHYGNIKSDDAVVDEVLVSVFRNPKSYTGDDMVEISCHDSEYIKHEILRLIVSNGGRIAGPGEFTVRAFLAGKMDLAQAEAVADTIASSDRASHAVAINQMKGGYSTDFMELRGRLLHILSLLELELDFGEEDVEFADRAEILHLLEETGGRIETLEKSFALGNAIKKGVPVAIIGSPNAGKSTLLNALLKDDRAMVSDIAGTTRDTIEERLVVDGIAFRFIDTAGIRQTTDVLENMGIARSVEAASKAGIVLILVDAGKPKDEITAEVKCILDAIADKADKKIALVVNKTDLCVTDRQSQALKELDLMERLGINTIIGISAKHGINIESIMEFLSRSVETGSLYEGASIVTNVRHWESLRNAHESMLQAASAIRSGVSGDLVSQDLRAAVYHLGLITGEITTDEILGTIFSKFCIGK